MAENAFWNNWKNSSLPATGSTISNTRTSGIYGGFAGGQENQSLAVDPYATELLNANPARIKEIADMLVSAGYLRKTTTKYNKTLADAYSRAGNEAALEASRTGRPGLTLGAFLQENAGESISAGVKNHLHLYQ